MKYVLYNEETLCWKMSPESWTKKYFDFLFLIQDLLVITNMLLQHSKKNYFIFWNVCIHAFVVRHENFCVKSVFGVVTYLSV